MRVVVCGGGVIGACTALFLSRRGVEVAVVERAEVATAASGKAGGFLARDWCAGTPLDALARRSFHLHATLVKELAGDWAYQRMSAFSGIVAADSSHRPGREARPAWLSESVQITHQLGAPDSLAIVHPRKFTTAIMGAAQRGGAQIRTGRVTGIA